MKIQYSGSDCPSVGYDGTPCGGQVDCTGVVEYADEDWNVYQCDKCRRRVMIERNVLEDEEEYA